MTIVEKNGIDGAWLFRTQPLQIGQTQSMREISLQLAPIPTPVPMTDQNHSMTQHEQQQQLQQRQQHHQQQQQQQQQHKQQQQQQQKQQQQQQQQKSSQAQAAAVYTQQNQQQQQQGPQHIEHTRHRSFAGPIPTEPTKVAKSSTAPNLRTSNSLSEMFRVI